jgi:hypothetical protein
MVGLLGAAVLALAVTAGYLAETRARSETADATVLLVDSGASSAVGLSLVVAAMGLALVIASFLLFTLWAAGLCAVLLARRRASAAD